MTRVLIGLLVLCALMAWAPVAPAAAQGGGSARCAGSVNVPRDDVAGDFELMKGRYGITVRDTAQLTCTDASRRLREFLSAPGDRLPDPWRVNRSTGTFSAGKEGSFSVSRIEPVGAGDGFSWQDVEDWVVVWLPILFMGLIAVAILFTVRAVPRTKPQEIKPQSSDAIGWDDVAGVEEAKHELREVVEFLRDPKRFRKLGATVPKGILLHGPPGTGKTLLAKAVAHESNAKFFAQSASSFVEMFAGLGAARIRRLFRIARKEAPAIIFIDELDAVGATRGKDISGEKDQTLIQLLVELDGFGDRDQVVVIAASNLLDKLDPALLRPGRFDRQVFVTPPDLAGRREIIGVHTRGKPLAPDVDLEIVARQTSGLTGADLANICNEAAIFAGREHRESIVTKDFQAALERVIAGMQSRRVISPHEKRVVAYHEAGHALCSEMLDSVEKLHRVSIVPRGKALGYTLNLPDEDRYLKTKDELMDYMVMLLGGRVTENLIFGQVTTGASDDLRKVHDLSRAMITQYGMGTELQSKQLPSDDYSMSDHTRRTVDEEQQFLADLAHRRAAHVVSANRPLLESFASTLLENEVLEREDIDVLVARYKLERGDTEPDPLEQSLEPDPAPGPVSVAAARRLEEPRMGIRRSRVAFVHPKATGGVLTEL
ncbi:MAG TPA: AAA family ATPase, partial [Thermoleophilaceae bacterium]|nr:AAA family ATPase [Thermoleophilaceae bacterium]